MQLFLTIVSALCWTIVYLKSIQIGFKEKTYAMPLFALGLNFAWEIIYSCEVFVRVDAQTIANIVWCLCDAVIVYTYFKYGKKYFPENAKKYFTIISIVAFATCFAIQMAFRLQFEVRDSARYSAFLQNAVMSIMFIEMLFRRNSTEGQSLVIAVAKWIGTLAPTILMGILWEFNIYVIMCGILCSIFDVIYIVLLYQKKRDELTTAGGTP